MSVLMIPGKIECSWSLVIIRSMMVDDRSVTRVDKEINGKKLLLADMLV